jgi:hypothetical protein
MRGRPRRLVRCRARSAFGATWLALALATIASGCAPASAQSEAGEAFRVRITNAILGPVEISTDQGKTWQLAARVARRVGRSAHEVGVALATVQRTSPYGIAIGLGLERVIKVLPDSAAARNDSAAILLNVPANGVFFRELLPPVGSPVERVLRGRAEPWQPGYDPQDGDVLQLVAPRAARSPERVDDLVRDAAARYLEMAVARLKGRNPTRGMLTVVARLAEGENAHAVMFYVDGEVRAIVNTPPFEVRWDTRTWSDGEHLIEVKALDENGATLTQSRTLVVVRNRGA